MVRTNGFIRIVLLRRKYRPLLEGEVELKFGVRMASLGICSIYSERQDSWIILKPKHS